MEPSPDDKPAMTDAQDIRVTRNVILGRLIRELRNNLDIPQIVLAERMGWKKNNGIVRPLERGDRALQTVEIDDMAKALEINPYRFLQIYLRRLEELELPLPPEALE